MSRIIVKNLPNGIKEERVRSIFGELGQITDCSLKYTKEGVFRKFCFIGYKLEENAANAVKHFNRTFIDTTRIAVELCKDLGDVSKPRAWSKYSADSSAYKKMQLQNTEEKPQEKEKKKKKDKGDGLLGDLGEDEQFQEFLDVHKSRSTKALWTNDTLPSQNAQVKGQSADQKERTKRKMKLFDDSDEDEADEEAEQKDRDTEADTKPSGSAATSKGLSDLEYLKSKVTNSNMLSDSDDSGNDSGSDTSDADSDANNDAKSDAHSDTDEAELGSDQPKTEDDAGQPDIRYKYIVKMKGLPVNIKESQIVDFFKPIMTKSIKIPRNAKGKKDMRVATVTFDTESDMEQAMRRNKNFVGQKKIFLHKIKEKSEQQDYQKSRPWELKQAQDTEELEGIDESGRLFIRNLSYFCQEAEIEALFGKYGPLTEVALPLDSFTKKIKGFAYVTYMIPEHAVKAYTDLDGKVFQGRLLHILPAKQKKEPEVEITDSMSYKQKKDMELKKTASSSHNWNTLFLGANAVADIMAEKYGTSKDHILSADSRQSVGVRLALGETLVVAETRDFLLEHGVALDSFSQAAAERSKTVMLAKNLPAQTKGSELQEMFGRFGTLGRLVLPPSGVTAIIEFAERAEARNAFKNLAYTKFKHIPLYLEWAPMDIFTSKSNTSGAGKTHDPEAGKVKSKKDSVKPDNRASIKADPDAMKPDPGSVKPDPDGPGTSGSPGKRKNHAEPMETDDPTKEEEDEEEEEVQTEPGSLLFVKNLNFNSTEDAITLHFEACGKIHKVTIAKKKDMKNPGKFLSMGYGFVSYLKKKSADKALKRLQHSELDDHKLEIKISHKATVDQSSKPSNRKKQDTEKKQTSTKILVRNIPFEAKQHEVRELFSTFGELKFVRLPKKMSGTGSHRGFGFVDFLTKGDAKRAFEALCHSTHLYGRRLVLEWAEEEVSIDDLRQKTADHFYDGPAKKKLKKSSLVNQLNTVTKFDD